MGRVHTAGRCDRTGRGLSRREFLTLGAGLALAGRAGAQATARRPRLCWLSTNPNFSDPYNLAFVQRLGELGFAEGPALEIARRHADGRLERLPAVAAELAALGCDLLFAGGGPAQLRALMGAARQTPIVFLAVDFDPVTAGVVASHARPGGWVTGISAEQSTLPGKRLDLMKALLPQTRRVAVFSNPQTAQQLAVAREAAARLGLLLHVHAFENPPFDYDAAIADALGARADALFVLGSALFVPGRRAIPASALKARLPSVFHHSQWAEAGGLMSYGFNFADMHRICAEMVAKILRGAKPAGMPIEVPTRYELALNLRTARALGVRVSPEFETRVDRMIE